MKAGFLFVWLFIFDYIFLALSGAAFLNGYKKDKKAFYIFAFYMGALWLFCGYAGWVFYQLVLADAGLGLFLPLFMFALFIIGLAGGSLLLRMPCLDKPADIGAIVAGFNALFWLMPFLEAQNIAEAAYAAVYSAAPGAALVLAAPAAASLQAKFSREPIPAPFRGAPIILLSAALFALAFSPLAQL